MIVRGTTPRGLGGVGLAALMVLGALLLPLLPTRALTEPPADGATTAPPPGRATDNTRESVPTTSTPAPKADGPAPAATPASRLPADEAPDVGDAIELARAQLDVKVAELAEAKALLDKARRQAERAERLNSQKAIGQDDLDAARTDVTVQQARVQAKEAQVREAQVRLKQAERRQAGDGQPGSNFRGQAAPAPLPQAALGNNDALAGPAPKQATPTDVEGRLRELEKKVDGLLKEMEALRRDLKQRPGAPGTPQPAQSAPTSSGSQLPRSPTAPQSPGTSPTPPTPPANAIR